MFRNFFVFYGDDAVEILYHGDFRSHRVVEVGELNANGTRAHHNEFLGLFGQGHGFAIADDFFPVLREARQLARTRACGQYNMVGLIDFLFFVLGNAHLLFGQYFPKTVEDIDLVFFH